MMALWAAEECGRVHCRVFRVIRKYIEYIVHLMRDMGQRTSWTFPVPSRAIQNPSQVVQMPYTTLAKLQNLYKI